MSIITDQDRADRLRRQADALAARLGTKADTPKGRTFLKQMAARAEIDAAGAAADAAGLELDIACIVLKDDYHLLDASISALIDELRADWNAKRETYVALCQKYDWAFNHLPRDR